MRFRTGISDPLKFSRIIQTVEKIHKECIIRFTENEMHIICKHGGANGGVQIWSTIKVATMFTEYRIQSNANNHIILSLSTDALLAALRSAASPMSHSPGNVDVVAKLAKKNDTAVLSFEIVTQSRVGKGVRITHDVRIEVLRPDEATKLDEPLCPEPDVHILLPPLSKMRTVVERLRSHADYVAVRANNSGCLQLSVSTDSVKTDVNWNGLSNPSMNKDAATQSQEEETPSQDKDPARMYSVLLTVKDFMKFLNSHVVSTTTIACICHNHAMILYVYIGEAADAGGILTFYLPTTIDES